MEKEKASQALHTELMQTSGGGFAELVDVKREKDGTCTGILRDTAGCYTVADDLRIESGRLVFLFGKKYPDMRSARKDFTASAKAEKSAVRNTRHSRRR